MEGRSEEVSQRGGDKEIRPRMKTVRRVKLRQRWLQKHEKNLEGFRKNR